MNSQDEVPFDEPPYGEAFEVTEAEPVEPVEQTIWAEAHVVTEEKLTDQALSWAEAHEVAEEEPHEQPKWAEADKAAEADPWRPVRELAYDVFLDVAQAAVLGLGQGVNAFCGNTTQ